MAYKQKGWEAFSGAGDSPMKNKPQYSRKGKLLKHGRGDALHKDHLKKEQGKLIMSKIAPGGSTILLDEKGASFDSRNLSKSLASP